MEARQCRAGSLLFSKDIPQRILLAHCTTWMEFIGASSSSGTGHATTFSSQSYDVTIYGEFQLLFSLWKLVSNSKAHSEDEASATLLLDKLLYSSKSFEGYDLPRPRIFTGQRTEFGFSHS